MLCKLIEEIAAGQELLDARIKDIDKKLDGLFHNVPAYEEHKIDQTLIPRSGGIRRRLEMAERLKAKRIPEAS